MTRTIVRLAVAAALVLAYRTLGAWLVGIDPLAELLDGHRAVTAVALLLFVALRFAAWFAVVPWILAGAVADRLEVSRATAPASRRPATTAP